MKWNSNFVKFGSLLNFLKEAFVETLASKEFTNLGSTNNEIHGYP